MTDEKPYAKIISRQELKDMGPFAPSASRAWKGKPLRGLETSQKPGGGGGMPEPKAKSELEVTLAETRRQQSVHSAAVRRNGIPPL